MSIVHCAYAMVVDFKSQTRFVPCWKIQYEQVELLNALVCLNNQSCMS
jgi:hypothetical protein